MDDRLMKKATDDAPRVSINNGHQPIVVRLTYEQARRLSAFAFETAPLPSSEVRAMLRYVLGRFIP